MADNRQRNMPLPDDRVAPRGQPLAYPEAVLLVNPIEPELKGEVHLLLNCHIIMYFGNGITKYTPASTAYTFRPKIYSIRPKI